MVCPHPETIEIAWVLRDRLKLKDPDAKGGPPRGRRPFVGWAKMDHFANQC
jgi:hypothetical protein